jgi:hypothetical protein
MIAPTAILLSALAAPTFNRDIAPILNQECVRCHRPGEVAPFSLLTYADAQKRAGLIARVTRTRYMPPWKPEPGYGDFRDGHRLSDAQVQMLDEWAAASAPEGDGAPPPAPVFASGWRLGPPDRILQPAESFHVRAEGPDLYQCFVIPLGLSEDAWVTGVEFHPGNKKVVHHALFFLDTTGKARELDAKDPGPGYRQFGGVGFSPSGTLGGWAPGANPRQMPDGVGYFVAKGADLVLQVHYHPDGKVEEDQSQIGITFAKVPPKKRFQALALLQPKIDIPAGEKDFVARQTFELPIALEAVGITPHMHWLGRSMKVWANLPDGRFENLIYISDWDFNWQGQYLYRQPLLLPKGTKISLEAHYDNSAANPRNPSDPPRAVSWGEQTRDEMCVAFIDYATSRPEDKKDLRRALVSQVGLFNLLKLRNRNVE